MSEEQPVQDEKPVEEPKVDDRPEENYRAELARKNAEIERLRLEKEEVLKNSQPKRDPNDIRTWNDNELKMLMRSNDASVAAYKEQAEDILLERKVEAIRRREADKEKREHVESELSTKYPEALDSTSEFSLKMNQVMREYDLAKTPAGKLAAARIVAAEGKSSGKSVEQKEKDRVAALKANLTDGDRPRPVDVKKPGDSKTLKEKILNEKDTSHEAMAEWVDSKGLREKFGKVWGQ